MDILLLHGIALVTVLEIKIVKEFKCNKVSNGFTLAKLLFLALYCVILTTSICDVIYGYWDTHLTLDVIACILFSPISLLGALLCWIGEEHHWGKKNLALTNAIVLFTTLFMITIFIIMIGFELLDCATAFWAFIVSLVIFGTSLYASVKAFIVYDRDRVPKKFTSEQLKLLINICSSLIDKYENEGPAHVGYVTCKPVLINILRDKMRGKVLLIDDIEKNAHVLLLNMTASLLGSGEYHIWSGELNPLGVAPSLAIVHDRCAKWLLDNAYMSEEEYDNHNKALQESINFVG